MYGQGIEVLREGNPLGTGVKDSPETQLLADGLREGLEASEVALSYGGGGFHVYSYETAGAVFKEHVDLLAALGPVMVGGGVALAPGGLLYELHCDEALQKRTGEGGLFGEPLGIDTLQVSGETSVAEHYLWRAHQAL